MSTVWNKLDPGLSSIYSKYRRSREQGSADAQAHRTASAIERVNVSLYYSEDLPGIEALGFETAAAGPAGFANGTLDLANLERIAAHPGVVKISFGESRTLALDLSVPNIRASEIWTRSGATFTGFTGKGVIIGIIDTGIDIHHPFFFTTTEPKRPRIFRIWDQGLEPQGVDKSPDANLLSGGATYGVEYDQARIVAGLAGLGDFRHRDSHGHGTHVASIAAGNGQDKFKFIGVAPEADLIIVRHKELEKEPQVGGVPVSEEKKFRDAVAYILNVTKNFFDNRPVVINVSFWDAIGPHDGLTADDDFLTATFDGVPGRCFVAAAGNEGQSLKHASIKFGPNGGQVAVPLYLYDERTNYSETYALEIRLYYPLTVNAVTVALKLPGENPIVGPALGSPPVGPIQFAGGRSYEMSHAIDPDPLPFTNRGLVIRSRFNLKFRPNDRGLHVGNRFYILTIGAAEEVVVHLWTTHTLIEQGFQIGGYGNIRTPPNPPASGTTLALAPGKIWQFPDPADGEFHIHVGKAGDFETMKVTARSTETGTLTVVRAQQGTNARAVQVDDGVELALPVGVSLADTHQMGSPAGALNVIGVAGYDAETPSLPLYFASSRGPLVTYTIPQGLQQPAKPDIAAPGVSVDAARSQGRIGLSKKRRPTQILHGTSMAAPHVTGTVALMLQKKPQLTTQQILNLLKTNVRIVTAPVTPLTANEAGAGRLDAKKTLDNTT